MWGDCAISQNNYAKLHYVCKIIRGYHLTREEIPSFHSGIAWI
jgi:hypothetical protein